MNSWLWIFYLETQEGWKLSSWILLTFVVGIDIVNVKIFRSIKSKRKNNTEMSWKQQRKVFFFCCWLQDVNLCTHFKTLECIIESLNVVCARMLTWSFIEDTAQMRKNTRRTTKRMRKLGEFQNFKISLRKSLENEKMSTHEFFSSWFSSSEFLIVIFK